MFKKSDVADIYSLSPMQEGMLFHYIAGEKSSAYFEQVSYRVHGELDYRLIEDAFNRLLERYDILRTVFVYKSSPKPRQVVLRKREANVYFENISHLGEEEKKRFIEAFKKKDRERGFDLTADILTRYAILKLAENSHEVIWSFHHIIMDGWCTTILIRELLTIYSCLQNGSRPQLPAAATYNTYIRWLEKQDVEAGLDYWQGVLESFETPSGIPKIGAGRVVGFEAGEYRFTLPGQWERICGENKATLNDVFQALWGLLLQKYNNSSDVVFGVVVSGRPAEIPGIEEMVGLFINTVPLRVSSEPGERFDTLVANVHRHMGHSKKYEYLSLADIQAQSSLKGELLDHIVVFENYPLDKELENLSKKSDFGLSLQNVEEYSQTNYDLSVVVFPREELTLKIKYNALVYDAEMIKRVAGHLERILEQVSADNNIRLDAIDILSEGEKRQLVVEFNDSAVSYPEDKTIPQLFVEQVEKTPDHAAVVFKDRQLTYRALDERADRLAGIVAERIPGPDAIVGIMMGRSLEMIIGLLAILKAGAAYLPIESGYPEERIHYMLKDSGAELLINEKFFGGSRGAVLQKSPPCSVNLAYLIYTSGSTGKPKGVLIEHRNVVNVVTWFARQYGLGPGVHVVLMSDYTFDASVNQVFGTLLHGAVLYAAEKDLILDIPRLRCFLRERRINIINFVPALLKELLCHENKLESLHTVLSGAEKLADGLKDELIGRGYALYNQYGPTENTIDALSSRCGRERVTLGKPIANVQCYILDRHLMLLPVGVPGELVVSGAGVARGYLNNPELTNQKFIIKSFWKSRNLFSKRFLAAGGILYRTGDLARWLVGGDIEFLGRSDQQVKIRGFRIEPGEIETRLARHRDIKETVVLVKKNNRDDNDLCAYYVAAKELAIQSLRDYLAGDLPGYMIPSYFIQVERMPLTSGGKIDRAKLPGPDEAQRVPGDEYIAPVNEKEKLLARIWSGVLGVEKVGRYDNFFTLGGHSLKAVAIISRINKELAVQLPVSVIFGAPTIAGLMEELAVKRGETLLAMEKSPESKYYHLSRAQKRLWFFQQMAPTSPAYHILMSIRITGFLDIPKLKQALELLVQRHEMLRTSIVVIGEEDSETGQDEFPAQVLHDRVEFDILQKDISHLGPEEKDRRLQQVIEEVGKEPFDLARAPLFRVALVRLDVQGREHVMVFVKHHIISDARSINNMVKEFIFFYDRLGRGLAVDLEPLAFQYKDFAHWQNTLLANRGLGGQEEYWLQKLAGELPVLDLVTDFPRRSVQGSRGDKVTFSIDIGLTAKLKTLAGKEVSTLFMILAAAFKVLLYRYTNREDIIVGTLTAGRPIHELEKIMGYFVNILALRDTVLGEWKFDVFLKRVRKTMLGAYDNQDYPFDRLVDQLKVERNPGRSPVFDIMLVMQAYEDPSLGGLETLEIKPVEKNYVVSKYDLYLDIMEMPGHITVDFEYSVDLFKRETIAGMVGHYLEILRSAADRPQEAIARMDMLAEAEKAQLIIEFNNTAAGYPRDKTIHRLFAEQVCRTPDRIAVVGATAVQTLRATSLQIQLTYRQLNEQAAQLANVLVERGVLADTIVGIMLERSLEMIIAIFAILKAGGAYLPIDPEYPQERVNYMLKDSNALVLIDEKFFRGSVPAGAVLQKSPPCSANLAYIIYTSGSTGKPKGVMVEHRSVVNRLNWMQRFYPLGENGIILQKTPISFDVSVWELFWWAFNGAAVCLLGVGEQKNPQATAAAVEKNRITVMHFVPSMLNVFLEYIEQQGRNNVNSGRLRSLTHVFASGEALSPNHVERFNRLLNSRNGTRLINLYGPTEATVDVSYFEVPGENSAVVPIGKPIDNIQLHILDKNQVLLPVGVPGELHISGDGLARGYLNRPELTNKSFWKSRNLFSKRFLAAGGILYRTGDLARWLPDGNIEYLGRLDHQVKIRGLRIELGEIENCLMSVGLKAAVVIVREDEVLGSYLCAYVMPGMAVEVIKAGLAKKLPEYMVPAHFVEMQTIPLLPNGKVNRALLPEPGLDEPAVKKKYTEPGSKTEKKIADIWTKALKTKKIGIHDNFFELGGHSLIIPRLFTKLDKAFPGKLEIADLFEYVTIYRLARRIDGNDQPGGGNHEIVELSID